MFKAKQWQHKKIRETIEKYMKQNKKNGRERLENLVYKGDRKHTHTHTFRVIITLHIKPSFIYFIIGICHCHT